MAQQQTQHTALNTKPDFSLFKSLLFTAAPIIFQNLTQSFINMLDTIMVGRLGEVEIAAVGLGNQIYFMMTMILFGIASGASIFIAQFWGQKDVAGIRKTLGLSLSAAGIVSVLFMAAALAVPKTLISLYSADTAVIKEGGAYLRAVAVSYPITAVSFVYAQALRSTEKLQLPLAAAVASLAVNGLLNYLFIFGVGPFPELGVVGAAIGTVAARVIELALLLFVSYRRRYPAAGTCRELFSFNGYLIRRYIIIAVPVIINETLWGGGITMQNSIFAHAGTDAIAAFNITGTISQLTWVFFIGCGNAAAIVIGKRIGEHNDVLARKSANTFALYMPLFACAFALLLLPLSRLLPLLFKVSPHIIEQAAAMLYVLMVSYPFKAFNMCMVVGVCRSGGDTVFAAVCDVAFMWLIALPLGALAALYLHAPAWIVYCCVICDDWIKAALGLWRLRSGKWLHHVTEPAQ